MIDCAGWKPVRVAVPARGRSMTWLLGITVLLFILKPSPLLSIAGSPETNLVSAEEFQMKAIWLEKCSMFIEWPGGSNVKNPDKLFIIVVLGDSPLSKAIHTLYVEGKQRFKEKRVVLKTIADKDKIPPCNLLFISRAAKYRLAKIIAEYEKQPVLIASDTDGFAERGVHINFIVRNRVLGFEVNLQALENSGFLVGYHLSKAALRVINPPREESDSKK